MFHILCIYLRYTHAKSNNRPASETVLKFLLSHSGRQTYRETGKELEKYKY